MRNTVSVSFVGVCNRRSNNPSLKRLICSVAPDKKNLAESCLARKH